MLLHSNPNRVAIIGITTGVVASAVLDFPVQRVVAVDQLPSVVEVLPYFDRWNRSFYKDDRVELVVGSGRSYLLGTDQQFDLMIGDPIFPARSASADLCTVEHFQLAHQRLAPGGILVQWLSAQQWSTEELRTVAASMLKVFPTVTLWRADFDIQQPILGLIAYHDTPAIDRAATSASCARLAENNTLPAPFLSDPASAQMLYVCGDDALREWAQGATLNTDNRPVIAYATPKNFVQDRARNLQGLFDFLAQIRPRKWCYDETIAWQPPADTLLRAADLVDDASIAATWNNFEQEYRIVRELAQLAGEVPIVAEYIVAVAARYRSRQMTMRSTDLLTALVQYPDPPLAALLALAEARNLDGEDAAAITLMERGVAKAPNRPEIRRRLVQWLKTEGRYDQAEPHLLRLVGALPNDPYIRLDLAHVLDRQGKSAEAREQVDAFKERWNGEDAKTVWRYMRRLGLGGYATTRPPEPPGGQSMTEGTDAPPDAQEKNLSGPDEDE
jgi:tetratricopeptide (TPR) repeat protein